MGKDAWTIIEKLFHSTMERPFDQRYAFLKDAANSDDEYDAVKKLVEASQSANDFMQTSLGLGAFLAGLEPGQRLGVWTVIENIGSGGMGEIYRVERLNEDFMQIAALKIARTKDPQYLTRFEQERRILAQLEHAHIGRLIDGGTSDDAQPYFVMELIEGDPITAFAEKSNLNAAERLRLFKQLCQAVSHAHSRLILHRDIKPSNVMVTGAGEVKLIDFGTSDHLSDEQTTRAPLTRAYAAPEQLSGERITTATDIYALGCLLHQLISGVRLSLSRIVSEALPADLRSIITKCIAERPEERYDSVSALYDDVERYENDLPVAARQGGFVYKFRKSVSRNRLAYAMSALLTVSLLAGLGGTYYQMRKAQSAVKATQAARLEQEFEARTLTGYSYGLHALYGHSVDGADAIDPTKIDASMINLAESVHARFDGRNLEDAFLLYSMSQVLANRYDFENAAKLLEPLQDYPKDTPITQALSFEARSDLARYWLELGRKAQAEKLIRALVSDREETGAVYDLAHVQDANTLATLSDRQEDKQLAIDVNLKTLTKWERDNADADEIGWLYNQLGWAHFQEDRFPQAIRAFEKAFLLRRNKTVKQPDDITHATNLAQFQIYFNRDGHSPQAYLPDYLLPALNEFGAPHVYAFIQGLRAEAALLEKDWVLAEELSRDGLPHIAENRAYRDGWYYEMIVMRVRALVQMDRLAEARDVLQQAKYEFAEEADISGWGFTACKLQVTDSYVGLFEKVTETRRSAFEQAEKACRAASDKGWDKEPFLPHWLGYLRNEVNQRIN